MPRSLPQRFRDEFPVKDECVFLNHAAVCPVPRRTAAAASLTAAEQRDYGCTRYEPWERRLRAARQALAELVGADRREIAFIKNTTSGLIIAAEGIPWRDGDNVVTSSIEFPANIYPWLNLERRGVRTRMVEPVAGRVRLEDIAATMDARTRAVTVSWVQYTNGFRVDLAALAELCHSRGAYLVVDAIQGLGAIPLDVRAAGVDLLCADGHKWLLSVEGCGVMYVAPRMLGEMTPVNVGWMSVRNATDYGDYDFTLRDDARRFEEGSYNMLGIHALGASAGLLLEAGPEAVWEQIRGLTDRLVEGLRGLGWELLTPRGEGECSGIVTFRHSGQDAAQVVQRLWEARISVAARGGGVRAAPHFYNDAEEVDRLLEALRGM